MTSVTVTCYREISESDVFNSHKLNKSLMAEEVKGLRIDVNASPNLAGLPSRVLLPPSAVIKLTHVL